MSKKIRCSTCHGNGMVICAQCAGNGWFLNKYFPLYIVKPILCLGCLGAGTIVCQKCNTGKSLRVRRVSNKKPIMRTLLG